MDKVIRGITFKDIDKVAKSTYVDPYRELHTEVLADLDTGRLYVTEVGGDNYTISSDPHIVGVGIGKVSVDELIANIEDNFDYLEHREKGLELYFDENGKEIWL